ncbi:hypothetical protein H0H93_008762, partial [Arthromyces matolae]
MLSKDQSSRLCAAHFEFVKTQSAELIDLLTLVEDTIKDTNSLERQEWLKHMSKLCDVWEQREAGDLSLTWPDPPLTDEEIAANTPAAPSVYEKLSGYELREALRNERRANLDGADGAGPARQTAAKRAGRTRVSLADDLVLEFREQNGGGKEVLVVYCIACDK